MSPGFRWPAIHSPNTARTSSPYHNSPHPTCRHSRRLRHTTTSSAHICRFGNGTRWAHNAVLTDNSADFRHSIDCGSSPLNLFVRSVPTVRLPVTYIFQLHAFVASARPLVCHATGRHRVGVPLQLLRPILGMFGPVDTSSWYPTTLDITSWCPTTLDTTSWYPTTLGTIQPNGALVLLLPPSTHMIGR